MKVRLNVSGFDSEATFPDTDIQLVHKPLIEKFTRLYKEHNKRVVIFLCAPPGSGKSTLAAFWEHLSLQDDTLEPLQVLPFDGFHYPSEFLDDKSIERNGEQVSLRSIKGSFETFNLSELIRKLKQLKNDDLKVPTWPYYDRNIHDPVDDAIHVDRNIVVVEGNWLLLDEPIWNGLHTLCDFSIFIHAEPGFLKSRLVDRKVRGGSSEEEALKFYNRSDAINVTKVLNESIPADLTINMNQDGSFGIQ